MKLLVVFAFAGLFALANAGGCPNKCSGHGTCGLGDTCDCQPRWVGPDCSSRQCPYGLSWVTSANTDEAPAGSYANIRGAAWVFNTGLGGMHAYTECSSKGNCDGSTGECACYEGYTGRGCRRQSCPSTGAEDCSGHGRCLYNDQVNTNYIDQTGADKYHEFNSQYWDSHKTRQCDCDRGWEGYDCSSRICPKGDDPLTDCGTEDQLNDVQFIAFPQVASAGYFTLTFTDMFGGNYTTRPIQLDDYDDGQDYSAVATDIELALEELPNFAIPNVTVVAATSSNGLLKDENGNAALDFLGDGVPPALGGFLVEFVDDANSGQQLLLSCSRVGANTGTGEQSLQSDSANNQPRYESIGYANAKPRVCDVAHWTKNDAYAYFPMYGATFPLSGTNVLNGVAYDSDASYEEHVACSNRGICDGSTGTCECFEGHTGEACEVQTVFF